MKCLVLYLLVLGVQARKLPNYVKVCPQSDKNFNECLRESAEIIRPRLAKGIPELLIPPVSPFVFPEVSLIEPGFNATFRNIRIYHLDEFVPDVVNFDVKKLTVLLKVHLDRLRLMSEYQVQGKILILQLNGGGNADGNFTKVNGELRAKGELYTKNGKEFIKWTSQQLELDLGRPHFRFDRLFGENTELNEQTNRVINDNVEEFLTELQPVIKKVIVQFAFGLINQVFGRYSIDELFPY